MIMRSRRGAVAGVVAVTLVLAAGVATRGLATPTAPQVTTGAADDTYTRAGVSDPTGAAGALVVGGGGAAVTYLKFDVTALPESGGLKWFQLVPKHADTDFHVVRIGFDKRGELASMFLADKLDQITQLTFSNPRRNEKFAPDLFTFVPPPGVDVIGRGDK